MAVVTKGRWVQAESTGKRRVMKIVMWEAISKSRVENLWGLRTDHPNIPAEYEDRL